MRVHATCQVVIAVLLLSCPSLCRAEETDLSFRIGFTRTRHAANDTVVLVTTVINSGPAAIRRWGYFDFTGGYEPSNATYVRWRKICDSLRAAQRDKAYRCFTPRLPVYFLLAREWVSMNYPEELPLREFALAPGESQSDTLVLRLWSPEFELWPGYVAVSGELMLDSGPEAGGMTRFGKSDLRVAIPVP